MGKTEVFRGFFVREESCSLRSIEGSLYLSGRHQKLVDLRQRVTCFTEEGKTCPQNNDCFSCDRSSRSRRLKVYPPLRGWFFFFAPSLAKLGLVLPTEANNYEFDESLVWLGFAGRVFTRLEIVTAKCICVIYFFFSSVEPGFVNFAARFIKWQFVGRE